MASCENKQESVRFYGCVLVAEDVRTNQILMKSLLGKLGLEVTIAEDGQEAVREASAQAFDVIFMDIEMPNMDGCQATRTLREQGITTPVIALTGHMTGQDETRCLDAGCNDYLSKPIDRRHLIEKLARYVPSDGRAEQVDTRPVIDWDTLAGRGFDEALVSSVMPMCVDDNRKRLQELASALKARDAEQARLSAHAIKGSFAMIGVVNLAQIALRIEEKAKQQDLSAAEQSFSSLEKAFQELQSLVSKPDWIEVARGTGSPVTHSG